MHFETDLLRETRAYAEAMLLERMSEKFLYHNLEHTQEVAQAAEEIGRQSDLAQDDLEAVLLAAWLHDTGYCNGYMNHEESSAQIAKQFLKKQGASASQIDKVVNCIKATQMPQRPKTLLDQVLCDADLHHLTTDDFFVKSEQLRQELAYAKGAEIKESDWKIANRYFLRDHMFFTQYGKQQLQPKQDQNLRKLEEQITQQENSDGATSAEADSKKEKKKKLKKRLEKLEEKLAQEKQEKPGRGVETMFRTTSTNHYNLSEMADNKANIMISINTIIVSLIVSVLIRKFEEFPNLIIPTAILTTVCLLTIVFAILATRPRFTSGTFDKEDIHRKQTNLLFFGNFHQMSLDDYEWGMKETLKNSDLLYTTMIRDIYYLGKVLGQKYKLLRISYTIFMYGFVFSVLTYAIALLFNPNY